MLSNGLSRPAQLEGTCDIMTVTASPTTETAAPSAENDMYSESELPIKTKPLVNSEDALPLNARGLESID